MQAPHTEQGKYQSTVITPNARWSHENNPFLFFYQELQINICPLQTSLNPSEKEYLAGQLKVPPTPFFSFFFLQEGTLGYCFFFSFYNTFVTHFLKLPESN